MSPSTKDARRIKSCVAGTDIIAISPNLDGKKAMHGTGPLDPQERQSCLNEKPSARKIRSQRFASNNYNELALLCGDPGTAHEEVKPAIHAFNVHQSKQNTLRIPDIKPNRANVCESCILHNLLSLHLVSGAK
jgi:hypothetical protein